jgi:hypothetical protein
LAKRGGGEGYQENGERKTSDVHVDPPQLLAPGQDLSAVLRMLDQDLVL